MDSKCIEALQKMKLPHLIDKFAGSSDRWVDEGLGVPMKSDQTKNAKLKKQYFVQLFYQKFQTTEKFNSPITEAEYIIPEILTSETQFVTEISCAGEQRECQDINSEGPEINHNKKIRVDSNLRETRRETFRNGMDFEAL
ncbi:Protein of unknown function [Gryllus bimaculatus]|nr:Protein of unknown function [Gryllus bimaculatus]